MKNFTYLLALVLIFTSCKKYEDGPSFSLRSKSSRVDGKWGMTSHFYNGKQDILTPDDLDDIWEFNKDGTFILTDPGYSIDNGKWTFTSNKEQIILTFAGSSNATSINILRLKNSEFWFSIIDGSDTEEFHFSSK